MDETKLEPCELVRRLRERAEHERRVHRPPPDFLLLSDEAADMIEALSRTPTISGDDVEVVAAQDYDICLDCNGAGDDGHGHTCSTCNGLGGVRPNLACAIRAYVDGYEYRCDEGGGHTPTEGERAMIEDAFHGFLARDERQVMGASANADQALAASPSSPLRGLSPTGFDPSRWQRVTLQATAEALLATAADIRAEHPERFGGPFYGGAIREGMARGFENKAYELCPHLRPLSWWEGNHPIAKLYQRLRGISGARGNHIETRAQSLARRAAASAMSAGTAETNEDSAQSRRDASAVAEGETPK